MSDYELVHAYDTVNLHRSGGVARIELNRPQKMNAWDTQLGLDLRAAVDRTSADDEVRAVLLTGAGRGFSSGADLSAGFDLTPEGHPDLRTVLVERYAPIITSLRAAPKPVIAAVGGGAVGIGCSLALAADLVLAAESAYFLLAFVNIGLVPDGGASAFIPARIGLTRATELAMLGERLPASKALDWGLINAVHPDAELAGAADALAQRLAAGPTLAHAGAKRQLNAWVYEGLDRQLALEAETQQEQAATKDFAEGAAAFLQKRAPEFKGV
ncbi:enoyl-CoA hydratase-related protein [Conexibacter arvalis]|uniref:2-(1,2-epoxy-1,2-dihydrophenyl)acetyl-CoA isomerase n=1 Tax=Conexibacter arvalis TaxID=912552 RepID=A0A840IDY9_9ACTN|nr:enoyl-CoA hydratase-related protein [Conexibacter arvalis]MBB4662443.1 2-(1,2-epoxy-1,2-dihydrophenyl)acetyl-CoA isomerase [Conexibacter arvalis]